VAAVFAAQFRGGELLEADDALSYFGQEGRVRGEEVQGVFVVVFWFAGDEEEMHTFHYQITCGL
jgi:hypothetical protein